MDQHPAPPFAAWLAALSLAWLAYEGKDFARALSWFQKSADWGESDGKAFGEPPSDERGVERGCDPGAGPSRERNDRL